VFDVVLGALYTEGRKGKQEERRADWRGMSAEQRASIAQEKGWPVSGGVSAAEPRKRKIGKGFLQTRKRTERRCP